MQIHGLLHSSSSFSFTPFHSFNQRFPTQIPTFPSNPCRGSLIPSILELKPRIRNRFVTCCISPAQDFDNVNFGEREAETEVEVKEGVGLESNNLWEQMKEIVKFTGPAAGLWICSPLMSLIDTVVIAQGSSLELAALGPGTVLCDNMSYVFMFLSIATSNMVATSLAKEDKKQVQYQLSVLLFIGLTCGFMMFLFTKFFGPSVLAAFAGSTNSHIVPAANTYVQDVLLTDSRLGLASDSYRMGCSKCKPRDEGCFRATEGAGSCNCCEWNRRYSSMQSFWIWNSWCSMGNAGFTSNLNEDKNLSVRLTPQLVLLQPNLAEKCHCDQVVAASMMMDSLNKKGYNAYAISIPTTDDLVEIFGLAAPVFVVMISKVAFFSLLVYFTTSMSTVAVAAHQVVIQVLMMGTVWGEPLCQTAQTFMPELLYGMNQSFERASKTARMLLKSLMITGTILGLGLGILGTSVLWFFPTLFTPDVEIIREMHKILIPYFLALSVTPCSLTLEGTLLAGRDLRFISLSMSSCFTLGALALLFVSRRGYGLQGCWFVLVGFQWARFLLALQRLLSPSGMLFPQQLSPQKLETA
ncbi:Protein DETOXIFICATION 46, chloroplastic [Linum perenne]